MEMTAMDMFLTFGFYTCLSIGALVAFWCATTEM